MTAPIFEFSVDRVIVQAPAGIYRSWGKRAFDIAVLLFAAPVILPALLVVIGAAWIAGGRPLYTQERVGMNGRVFRCWKVRTMVRDADAVLQKMIAEDPAIAAEWAVNQKLSRDPRITLIGGILRKTSLDELPQVWNVLRGDMSLVGPRPFTPDQQDLYPLDALGRMPYLSLRPGITGLWQVSRRNAGSFAERAHYDGIYATSMGFLNDIRLITRTFGVVLRATGK